MASPGRPLAAIFDPAGLRVTASVPQYKLPAMRGVREARQEFPELGRSVAAASVTLLPTADAATHVSGARQSASRADAIVGVIARHVRPRPFRHRQGDTDDRPRAGRGSPHGEMSTVYVEGDAGLSLRQIRLGEAVGDNEIREVLAGRRRRARGPRPVRAGIALQQGKQ